MSLVDPKVAVINGNQRTGVLRTTLDTGFRRTLTFTLTLKDNMNRQTVHTSFIDMIVCGKESMVDNTPGQIKYLTYFIKA